MGLTDLDHVSGIEHASDLQLMFDRPLACRAELAGQHGFFLCGQFHSR